MTNRPTSEEIEVPSGLSELQIEPYSGDVDAYFASDYCPCQSDKDSIIGFFALKICSSNARQMAHYLSIVLGFEEIAFRSLENGSQYIGSHVVRNGSIVFEIVNTLKTVDDGFLKQNPSVNISYEYLECALIQEFLKNHGEGVIDVALEVQSVERSFELAVKGGASIIRGPSIISDDRGSVKIATIGVPGTDIQHTFVEKMDFSGTYLPNYASREPRKNPVPFPIALDCIDHCVENYSWNEMMPQARFYAKALHLHKFWSVDESDVSTGNTALRSIVMASGNGKVKIPINEPAEGRFKSQIEEFYDFNTGPGIQHIALKTNDIVGVVTELLARGVEFNSMHTRYYDNLRERLHNDGIELAEDLSVLQKLNILVDYDSSTKKEGGRCNYILQIFTKPLHDRPTLFLEIIQRYEHDGFGKGTFKGLFESIEDAQKERGTLVPH